MDVDAKRALPDIHNKISMSAHRSVTPRSNYRSQRLRPSRYLYLHPAIVNLFPPHDSQGKNELFQWLLAERGRGERDLYRKTCRHDQDVTGHMGRDWEG